MPIRIIVLWLGCLLLLTACQQAERYQGYVEGRFHYIASPYVGILKQLNVTRGQPVVAGQSLFALDPLPQSAAVNEVKANLRATEQQIRQRQASRLLAETTYRRQQQLFKQHATSAQQLEESRAALTSARAMLAAARDAWLATYQELRQAIWRAEQKTVIAPATGTVFDTYFLAGELVPADRPVLSLLAPEEIKIIFFVSEKSLSRLTVNGIVKISCDGCANFLTARIDFISPVAEYTPPVIYSNETRENLVFRIEAIPNATGLHPGQPVTVYTQSISRDSATSTPR